MPASPEISVVVPVRDEEGSVAELSRKLENALPPDHEILFVDDGSTDSTWQRLAGLHDPGRVRLVRLRAPSGKSAALMAGFARCRAPVIFTLDGDLQDDPSEIPKFLAALDEGYHLVSGWKKVRHDPLHKVAASRVFNFVMRHATGLSLHDMNCGFKCYRAEVTKSIAIHGDQHRFIPVFAAHLGYHVGEVEVRHHARPYGRSKYGFSRLLKGFLDLGTVLLRTRFRDRPAHAFGLAALGQAVVGGSLLAIAFLGPMGGGAALVTFAIAIVMCVSSAIFLACGWLAEIGLDRSARRQALTLPAVREVRD